MSADMFFDEMAFDGRLSDGTISFAVSLLIRVGADCRLEIDPVSVSAECYLAFSKGLGKPGHRSQLLHISAESANGTILTSSHISVSGLRHGSEGFFLILTALKATITIKRVSEANEPPQVGISMSLRGFKSFRPSPVESRCGTLSVQGSHKNSSPDEVSGTIRVICNHVNPAEEWYTDADSLIDFVWRGLQFGHGGRIQAPLVQVYRPDTIAATLYRGSGHRAHLPSIHFMDQSDFIAALVARYESETPLPEAIWLVVGWLNSGSSIDEVRYLTLMTALETILDSLTPEAKSTVMDKADFAPIRNSLHSALDGFDLDMETRSIFQGSISGLNRSTLSRKVKSVIDNYQLPADIFNEEVLKMLNRQRNSIAHTGKALEDVEIWDSILKVRELIALIVFAEIGYKGRYESYVPGANGEA